MCGIAGYVGSDPPDAGRVRACLALMRRRGPDSASAQHWIRPDGSQVHLLHSRLSIIDLDDRANQPFRVGSRWIVYNGEIYNYLEIRAELARRQRTFATASDTEVLLTALDEFGWSGLDRCEGMWAFAAYDERDASVLLSRDRFGEKPLYVYSDSKGLYFGSEVKFIVALRGCALTVNTDHVQRYLVNGYKALYKDRHTFFHGLRELRPGTALALAADGTETEHRYWSPEYVTDEQMSYDEAVAGARERLIRSVQLRLRADVPLAFCMSGGVDSNALISIAKRVFGYDVHGFTIVNSDSRYEEQDLVEHAVHQLGIRHTAIPVQVTDFLPRLRTLVRQHDAPVYTITYYAQWLLQESIGERGYRISISGTAADEMFSGYYDHFLAHLYEIRHEPQLHAAALASWHEHIEPLVRNPFLRDPDLFVNRPGLRDHIFLNAEGFTDYLVRPWSEAFTEAWFTGDLLRNRMLNEMFHEAVPVILHEDDLNAMYFSIENRSPFLDRELFEFCSCIPTRHLIQDGRAKSVLREAVRGIAPDRIIDNRPKVGFNAPIYAFLDVGEPAVREALLEDSPVFEYVRRERIEALIAKPDLPNSESKFLFSFVGCKLFLEQFAG